MNAHPDQQYSPTQAQQATSSQQPSPRKPANHAASKRGRGRSGCLNCRRRRKKCDERKPVCKKCVTRGETCEWDSGFTFRLSGIDAQHPSMVQSRRLQQDRINTNDITKISFDEASSHTEQPDFEQQAATTQSHSSWDSDRTQDASNIGRHAPSHDLLVDQRSMQDNMMSKRQRTHSGNHSHRRSEDLSSACDTASTFRGLDSNHATQNQLVPVFMNDSTTADLDLRDLHPDTSPGTTNPGHPSGPVELPLNYIELEALDYLTNQSGSVLFPESAVRRSGISSQDLIEDTEVHSSPFVESPDITTSYPNATYKSLHTTLYHHMVETARNTALTRPTSPDQLPGRIPLHDNQAAQHLSLNWPKPQEEQPVLNTTLPNLAKIPRRRQTELWRNYLDEIALWLDMFDHERHFQLEIPHLAKSAEYLHYSVLALSARQLERRDPERPYTESLGLYQQAIGLVLLELHTLDTAVIASCVLLCVLEMMSSAPRAWGRHLNGCAMLLEAAGVNGAVGGVRQSLFWCFARMDVWGGFLGDTLTKIPTSRWFVPSKSMVDAISHFKEGSGCDSYANYAVFLCASVVNVISSRVGPPVGGFREESASGSAYSARWKALFELLENWYDRRPRDLQPIISFPSVFEEHQHPFPSVLYSNAPAINGNQLYHAAALLMLQEKPKDVRLPKSTKSILWHARQICGIAASNDSHGCWINALQPLWIAGKIMSHSSEHVAISEILAKIERETGWATAWRAQDLKDYWGDADG